MNHTSIKYLIKKSKIRKIKNILRFGSIIFLSFTILFISIFSAKALYQPTSFINKAQEPNYSTQISNIPLENINTINNPQNKESKNTLPDIKSAILPMLLSSPFIVILITLLF